MGGRGTVGWREEKPEEELRLLLELFLLSQAVLSASKARCSPTSAEARRGETTLASPARSLEEEKAEEEVDIDVMEGGRGVSDFWGNNGVLPRLPRDIRLKPKSSGLLLKQGVRSLKLLLRPCR